MVNHAGFTQVGSKVAARKLDAGWLYGRPSGENRVLPLVIHTEWRTVTRAPIRFMESG